MAMRIQLSDQAARDLGAIIGELAQADINLRHNEVAEIAAAVLKQSAAILLAVYEENGRVPIEHREALGNRLAEINRTMLEGCIQWSNQ